MTKLDELTAILLARPDFTMAMKSDTLNKVNGELNFLASGNNTAYISNEAGHLKTPEDLFKFLFSTFFRRSWAHPTDIEIDALFDTGTKTISDIIWNDIQRTSFFLFGDGIGETIGVKSISKMRIITGLFRNTPPLIFYYINQNNSIPILPDLFSLKQYAPKVLSMTVGDLISYPSINIEYDTENGQEPAETIKGILKWNSLTSESFRKKFLEKLADEPGCISGVKIPVFPAVSIFTIPKLLDYTEKADIDWSLPVRLDVGFIYDAGAFLQLNHLVLLALFESTKLYFGPATIKMDITNLLQLPDDIKSKWLFEAMVNEYNMDAEGLMEKLGMTLVKNSEEEQGLPLVNPDMPTVINTQ